MESEMASGNGITPQAKSDRKSTFLVVMPLVITDCTTKQVNSKRKAVGSTE